MIWNKEIWFFKSYVMEPTITPEEIERTSSVFDQWTEWWNGSIKESSGDQEPFYICTAINYTNGEPHMGMLNNKFIRYHSFS